MTSTVASFEQIRRRVLAEFLEMPGLNLTRQQAQRLWGLDRDTCGQLLDLLIEEQFLLRRQDGSYIRRGN